MNPQEARALAKQCERAKGRDRLLDAEICAAMLNEQAHVSHAYAVQAPSVAGGVMVFYTDGTRGRRLAPKYTTSIDTAVGLVPDGHTWHIPGLVKPRWDCGIVREDDRRVSLPLAQPCASPELAIAAAALHARATIGQQGGGK